MPAAAIVAHDPAWPTRAETLLRQPRSVFAPLDGAEEFTYEHIGSTAVPGLAAKPIVDLQVRMPSLPSLDALPDVLALTFVHSPWSRCSAVLVAEPQRPSGSGRHS
ncbi:GrpB family protein [Saccharopolyspora rhizosphaerae]|uniref:GrpB family protein n=1 Tax=Saccharopolyspora rhizosphaerae TaxID=2492662 RepID=UPI0013156167|nr:GrpB family protein [Saccharopolyspora rhizosphaerae]